jgi:Domain of unknown function (DUF4169)
VTADIVNLRRARKAKSRQEAERQAAENRIKFGRTKAQRETEAAILKLDTSKLDGARRANPDADDDLDPGSVS